MSQNGRLTFTGLALCLALVVPITVCRGADTPIQRVISAEENWEGTVDVDGVVIVAGGGLLRVAPGTRVRFRPRDDDDDGIGDSELRVEGELVVSGTAGQPVLFTSAAKNPSPADWKYIMINHATRARMSNAVVEYAYSGIQVHYTRGTFTAITARNNVDGFRFSTAPVTLSDSLLTGNENGLRFEERGAGAVIRKNRIIRNSTGVFAVVKCRGLTIFEGNVFEDNADYNVKVGDRQQEDVPFHGNWWGTSDPERIKGLFFDGRVEPGLGKVIYEPFLEKRP